MTKGQLIVLSGPSGVGKDTVAKALAAGSPGEFAISVSATSRSPREGEAEGEHYFFVSREEFERRIAGGDFLEHAQYNGNYYGTPRDAVDRVRATGKNVILVIEVQGAAKLRAENPDALLIFLMPPDWDTLKKRLAGRGTDSAEDCQRRFAIAKRELAAAGDYDFVVVNSDVQECAEALRGIVKAGELRACNRMDFVREVMDNA
jgi:guanylate kinase